MRMHKSTHKKRVYDCFSIVSTPWLVYTSMVSIAIVIDRACQSNDMGFQTVNLSYHKRQANIIHVQMKTATPDSFFLGSVK